MPENIPILTVTEITQDIKILLENTFPGVWVEGEVSNYKAAASGHFYFTLKDANACLAAAMFSRANRGLSFKLEDGLKVICFGKIDVYPPRGNYQLIVERIEPKGIGARQLAFEQLKARLEKEGLFAPERKKTLPLMPFRVGIVTSSTGAAVRDVLQILKKGASGVDVVIRSVRVQGDGAASEIACGIKELNEYKNMDAIIICRGGGSVEDLWSFNEEIVARAIAESRIPTISAVGHQINVTLSDLVADVFVETPSAAAKIIVDKKNKLLAQLDGLRYEGFTALSRTIHGLENSLIALKHALKSPLDRLREKQQFLDELSLALTHHANHFFDMKEQRMRSLIARLEALSPLAVLARGYSLSMFANNGLVLKDAAALKPNDTVKTILGKGAFIGIVKEVLRNDERKDIV